jgi:hypothetical protein
MTVPQPPDLATAATAFAKAHRDSEPFDRVFSARRFDINLATHPDGGWHMFTYLVVFGRQGMHVATLAMAPGSDTAEVQQVNPLAAHLVPDLAYTLAYHVKSLLAGKVAA